MTALDATSNLLNLAEISAAFAGFAALVSVLRQRGTRADALHDILRLRIVISTSMVVVIASLIPVGLANFQLSERLVWGVSACILLLLNYGVIFSFIKSYKPVQGRFPAGQFCRRCSIYAGTYGSGRVGFGDFQFLARAKFPTLSGCVDTQHLPGGLCVRAFCSF